MRSSTQRCSSDGFLLRLSDLAVSTAHTLRRDELVCFGGISGEGRAKGDQILGPHDSLSQHHTACALERLLQWYCPAVFKEHHQGRRARWQVVCDSFDVRR